MCRAVKPEEEEGGEDDPCDRDVEDFGGEDEDEDEDQDDQAEEHDEGKDGGEETEGVQGIKLNSSS